MSVVLADEGEEISVTRNVEYLVPGKKKQSMSVTFKYLSKDDYDDLLDDVSLKAVNNEDSRFDSDFEAMKKVVLDIDGITDAAGEPMAFSETILKRLLNIFPARKAITSTFTYIHTGVGKRESRTKN